MHPVLSLLPTVSACTLGVRAGSCQEQPHGVAVAQALSAEEARLQAELAAASEEVRSLAAAAAAAAAGEQRAEAAAAAAARVCAERSPSTAGAEPDPEEAFCTPVKRAKHG